MNQSHTIVPIVALGLMTLAGGAFGQAVTGFENGHEDWSAMGQQIIHPTGGNPDENMEAVFTSFSMDIRNELSKALLGDLTQFSSIRMTIDVKVNSLSNFFGDEITRDIVVELRDNTNANGFPYTSVYYNLGPLSSANPGWITMSAEIADTGVKNLPKGWMGTGGEDPITFEPILEPGRSFTSVLASIDSIHFTTAVPGYFFTSANFDVQIDNVGFQAEAGCYADCDTSGAAGTLDIFDFLCFQDSFVAGESYACDCETAAGTGLCDIFDFLCFQDAFVAGCP